MTANVGRKKKVIPIIKGARVTFPKSFRKYLTDIIGKHDTMELYMYVENSHTGHCAHFGKY
jgi:hypothetical protein